MAERSISHIPFDSIRINTCKKALMDFGRYALNNPFSVTRETVIKTLEKKNGDIIFDATNRHLDRLVTFLGGPNRRFYSGKSFGKPVNIGNTVLAFSYGAGWEVNNGLAQNIVHSLKGNVGVNIFAQWEIADLIPKQVLSQTGSTLFRIPINPARTNGHSGYKILDLPGLAEKDLIPDLCKKHDEETAKGLIDAALKDPGYSGRFDITKITERTPTDPITNAIKIYYGKIREGSKFPSDIQQLNMALLMASTQGKFLNFYIDSEGVLGYYLNNRLSRSENDLCLIAQSWHSARLIQLLLNNKIKPAAGLFADNFAWNDPQFWVTNPASWLIKEAGLFAVRPDLFPA